ETTERFNQVEFRRRISQLMASQQNQSLQKLNAGKSLMEMSRGAIDCGLYVPTELTLLGKTLLQLDTVGKILDPSFDPFASIRENAGDLLKQRFRRHVTPGNFFSIMLEMKNFLGGLPTKLNRVLGALTDTDFEIKIRAVDAQTIVQGFQKIANRITAGIILASLILGAALLMQVKTSFILFGYPGLAILCFLAAAAGGVWLLLNIFLQDEKIKKHK
ncbi:MAG TPA: AarF/ABC1/UbiB kinase family protein, partial [Verrucomicrobiae bacterium]|nr:AarF/ABC1/UbiB kinase family protein [Verrucomicrobiae bacterium]